MSELQIPAENVTVIVLHLYVDTCTLLAYSLQIMSNFSEIYSIIIIIQLKGSC